MIIPIRCFSCGKPIAHLYDEYEERVEDGESKKDVMDDLGLKRPCCRNMFLSHVDLQETASHFKKS